MRSLGIVVAFALLACGKTDLPGSGEATSAGGGGGGHAGIQDAARAFAGALASGEVATIRAQLPTRAQLAPYLACDDHLGTHVEATAVRVAALPEVIALDEHHATFDTVEDQRTVQVDDELAGCKLTEPIQQARVSVRFQVEGKARVTDVTLVRLGKRWFAFDVPAM